MNPVKRQLELLGRNEIDCVIVGGVAGTLHGLSLPTTDLDVCYSRTPENLEKLAAALKTRSRNAPADIPFLLEAETFHRGLNFTFVTEVGDIDLLGEVRGIGYSEDAVKGASTFELLGFHFKVIALDKLTVAKRTAGRPKDLIALAELEALLEAKDRKAEE